MSASHPIILSDSEEEEYVDIYVDPASIPPAAAEEDLIVLDSSDEEAEDGQMELDTSGEEEEEDSARDVIADVPRRAHIPVLPARPQEPSFRPYRLHPNGPIMMYTPRKRVRRGETFSFTLDTVPEDSEGTPDSPAASSTSPTTVPDTPIPEHTSPYPIHPPTLPPMPSSTYCVGESSRGVTRQRPSEPPMGRNTRIRLDGPGDRHYHLGDVPITYSFAGDPYRPPTSTAPPLPVDPIGGPSAYTPPHPVTGESLQDTVPLIIARSHTHDVYFEEIRDRLQGLPHPEYFEQLEHRLRIMRDEFLDVRDHVGHVDDRERHDLIRMDRRMDAFEHRMSTVEEVQRGLRGMFEELHARVSRLEDSRSRSEDQ